MADDNDFRSYDDRDRQRKFLFGAVTLGAAAAFALPAIRKGLVGNVLKGIEYAGSRLTTLKGPLGIQSTASQITSILERQLPRAAEMSIGRQRAESFLAGEFSRYSDAQIAAIHAKEIVGSATFGKFLGRSRGVEDLLEEGSVQRALSQRIAGHSIVPWNPALIEERERSRLSFDLVRARDMMPDAQELESNPVYQKARTTLQNAAADEIRHLAGHSQRTGGRVLDFLGVRPTTLGEWGTKRGKRIAGTLAQFGNSASVIDNLAIGGLYEVAGGRVDLRGAHQLLSQATSWARSNLQIPLAPGAMGINPLQLFPWTKGGTGKFASHLAEGAFNPVLAQAMGEESGVLGRDVFKMGRQFIGVDFKAAGARVEEKAAGLVWGARDESFRRTKLEAEAPPGRAPQMGGTAGAVPTPAGGEYINAAVQSLDLKGDLRSAMWGFNRKRTEEVRAALEMRQTGPKNAGEWLGLGSHLDHSLWGKIGSVLGKYKEGSDYAPVLMRRLLESGSETKASDVRRAAHFLTSRGLPASLASQMGGDLHDAGVLQFFESAAAHDPQNGGFLSSRLAQMVNEYRVNPGGVLNRIQPGRGDSSLLGWNFLGGQGEKRGIQLMREAILDEREEALRATDAHGFIDFVKNAAGLSAVDKRAALAYGHGKQLLQRLEAGKGPADAVAWLRGSREAQQEIGDFVNHAARPGEAWQPHEPANFGSADMFVQHRFSLIEEFNRRRAAGESFAEAMGHAALGGWGQQYAAFFTGKQQHVTTDTLAMEYFPRRLNEHLAEVGLGLGDRDLLSGGSIMGNLFLKRILPAVGGVEAARYVNHESRKLFGFGPSDAYANLRAHAGMFRAKHTGQRFMGLRRELLPGLDRYLPERDEKEEYEHQQSGYEPVRKGRFWAIGSRTPYYGEKIDHFAPSAVSVARSDWQAAENVDLASDAYWAASPLPTLENFGLGPISHFFHRRDWERKHAEGPNADRPYLISGKPFDPNTPHGPVLNALLGPLLKRQVILHPEYIPQSRGGTASQEDLRQINEVMKNGADERGAGLLVGGGGGAVPGGTGGGGRVKGPYGSPYGSPGVLGGGGGDLGSIAVITPAGQITPMTVPGGTDPAAFAGLGRSSLQKEGYGKRLSHYEIEKINRMTEAGLGGMTKRRPSTALRLATQQTPFSDADLDMIDYQNGALRGFHNTSELAGLYGFFARSGVEAAGVSLSSKGLTIADPSQATGYAHRWYDLNAGGLGGSTNEVGRRFLARPDKFKEWNPVRNRMPSWLPGSEYILDLKHGDPYMKIAHGAMRLPGEAYEAIHHTELMQTRASSLGKSVPELMKQMLFLDEPMSAYGSEATEAGTALHHVLQNKWRRMGILEAAETRIENKELGISGHFDAILRTQRGPTLVDIKTVNQRRYDESRKRPFEEHLDQVNYYLHETGVERGSILYVNRDKPWESHTYDFGFDKGRFNRAISRVQRARQNLLQLVDQGKLNRGDLYDPVTRFEILADTANYSENYAQVRDYLVSQKEHGQLSEEQNRRFQAAKKRAAAQKKRVDITPNRFRGLDLDYQTVTVDKILDPNTFSIKGSDNPIRLAGERSSQERIQAVMGTVPEGMTPAEFMFSQFGIRTGARVRVGLESDPLHRVADDTLKSMHAVVFARGGNVNKQLIESGIGTEKETDYSDTGVAARFSGPEIRMGKAFEWLSHLDTPLNNKFFRNRTAAEELERGIVYGKNTGGWKNAVSSYVTPTIQSYATKNPLIAAAALGAFASFFGKTRGAKMMLGKYGAIAGAGFSLLRSAYEHGTGNTWKPKRTQKREELEEYWDTLKYVKLRGEAAAEEKIAKKEEGVDVDAMARDVYLEGEKRKRRTNWLEKQKRQLILHDKSGNQEKIKAIQQKINRLQVSPASMKLGPHATRALQLRDAYRSTLYGYTEGAPFLNLFRAIPKYKRELVTHFIEHSDQKERKRIYRLLPQAEQRALGSFMGMKKEQLPQRPKLAEYFAKHPLPGTGWKGWSPEVSLDQLQQRAIKGEGLDPFDSGLYPQQIEEAQRDTANIPVPTLHGASHDIQGRLNTLLSGRGLKNLRVQVSVRPRDGDDDALSVNMHLRQHREQDLLNSLQASR